jgi:hypothetical protein
MRSPSCPALTIAAMAWLGIGLIAGRALAEPQTLCTAPSETTVAVDDAAALQQALKEASCGTAVTLAPGQYQGTFVLRRSCPPDRPLVIRAAEPQAAVLAGTLKLVGDRAIVSGLEVDGGKIEVSGSFNRVTRNLFLTGKSLTLRGGGTGNRVDHNEIATPAGSGVDVTVQFSKDDKKQARDNLIDFNLFRSRAGSVDEKDEEDDDGERQPSIGLYLGQFSARKGRDNMLAYGRVGTVVEHNLFLDYRRQNAIHIKSLGNIIRFNSLIDRKHSNHASKITVRSGQFNEIVANYMDGTTGLRIFEEHNRAIGNVLLGGAKLAVMAGSGEETKFGGAQQRQAEDTFLAGNAGPLTIGFSLGRREKVPARSTVVEAHQGPVEMGLEEGAVVSATTSVAVPRASPLTAAEVGLLAPDPGCPAP